MTIKRKGDGEAEEANELERDAGYNDAPKG
jgi:hypothetical protein